jgi:filamentous hemagglutinin family protein
MKIPQNLGKTAGSNLFHSFKTFNINTGESAIFQGADNLKNVISRVTGAQVSTINGLLKSEVGHANFYFINPAGVTFGANAQVNVPAAFYVSTANVLRFADGINFDTTANPPSSLSISLPYEFGFLGNQSGDIKIEGSILSFKNRNAVALSAGKITVDNAKVYDFAGDIKLHTIGKTIANILSDGRLLANGLAGQLTINNSGLHLDNYQMNGYNPGHLAIFAGNININNSTLSASNWQSTNAGFETGIDITANSLSMDNSFIETNAISSGNAPNIKIFCNYSPHKNHS